MKTCSARVRAAAARVAAAAAVIVAGAAAAEAPQTSPRPQARDAVTLSSSATSPWYEIDASAFAPAASPRPVMRAFAQNGAPNRLPRTGGEARAEWYNVAISRFAPAMTPRPERRSADIVVRARAAEEARIRGSVCGDPGLQGDVLGSHDGPGACGVENAVRLRSLSGLALSMPAIVNCRTASALRDWVDTGLKPAVGAEGGGPVEIQVMAHYACRGRNNVAGARLSEHAFGNAIDIGAVTLADGSSISVLRDWGSAADGHQLRQMHQTACRVFGTVLGPAADALHRDHFHFDTASYRSGSYCR